MATNTMETKIQMSVEADKDEEKQLGKDGGTVEAKTVVAPKEDESVWSKAGDFLMRYTPLNIVERLTKTDGNFDTMEKFFGMTVLMNALVYTMASAMATATSFGDKKEWYDECLANDELRKCLRNYSKRRYDSAATRNGKDICSVPIREFQNRITISHQLLAFALFVSATMYLYIMAFLNEDKDEDKEKLSDEMRAARDKRRKQTWSVFAVVAIGLIFVTIVAIVFYQLAYNGMVDFAFIVFAWQKGEHCASQNVRALSPDLGLWLVAFGLIVVCVIISCFMGRIHERPQTVKFKHL